MPPKRRRNLEIKFYSPATEQTSPIPTAPAPLQKHPESRAFSRHQTTASNNPQPSAASSATVSNATPNSPSSSSSLVPPAPTTWHGRGEDSTGTGKKARLSSATPITINPDAASVAMNGNAWSRNKKNKCEGSVAFVERSVSESGKMNGITKNDSLDTINMANKRWQNVVLDSSSPVNNLNVEDFEAAAVRDMYHGNDHEIIVEDRDYSGRRVGGRLCSRLSINLLTAPASRMQFQTDLALRRSTSPNHHQHPDPYCCYSPVPISAPVAAESMLTMFAQMDRDLADLRQFLWSDSFDDVNEAGMAEFEEELRRDG